MESYAEKLTEKPFRKGDFAVYAILAVVSVLCFVLSAFSVQRSEAFDVFLSGEPVLHYEFSDGSCRIYGDAVERTSENVFVIRSEKGYNELTVDKDAKQVTVTDADCVGKQCMAMKLSDGTVICVPHSIIIKYSGEDLAPRVG